MLVDVANDEGRDKQASKGEVFADIIGTTIAIDRVSQEIFLGSQQPGKIAKYRPNHKPTQSHMNVNL